MTDVLSDKAKITFNLAVERTGTRAQLDKTIEEMSEFIHMVMKSRANGVQYSHRVLEEMGHVDLCLEMIKSQLAILPSISDQGKLLDIFNQLKQKRLDDWYAYEIEQLEAREESSSRGCK